MKQEHIDVLRGTRDRIQRAIDDLGGEPEDFAEIEALDAAIRELEWVKCSERLPEKDGGYIVQTADGSMMQPSKVCIAVFEDGEFHGLFREHKDAIEWRPLPEVE